MYEIFEKLLTSTGLKAADVVRGTGLPSSLFSEWKRGKSNPKADKLQLIADFFGVSLEYLMTGKEKEGGETYYLNDDAREIAQFMFENPEYKVLFDASRKISKSDIATVKAIMDKFRSEE